jgi:hypothetical protein
MSAPTSWNPYDAIDLDEKISRTERFILELGAYSGPIAKQMLKNKRLLLKELRAAKAEEGA